MKNKYLIILVITLICLSPYIFLWYVVMYTDELPSAHSEWCQCYIIEQEIDHSKEPVLKTWVWFNGDIVYHSFNDIKHHSLKNVELRKAQEWVKLMESNQ